MELRLFLPTKWVLCVMVLTCPLDILALLAQTQMDSAPQKDGISNSMKERLMREASTGLDSDQKQPNVILYISLAIALLAVLGGAGIFY